MTELPSRKLLHKSFLWYGGQTWHRVAQAVCEIVALSKGYQILDARSYLLGGFQPDLVIRRRDKIIDGARRYNVFLVYAVEVVDSHPPSLDLRDYVRKAGLEDVLLVRRKDLKNDDSISELVELAERTIP